MFISSEDAHAFLVSIFGRVEHFRAITPPAEWSDMISVALRFDNVRHETVTLGHRRRATRYLDATCSSAY